ncbi:Aminotransferase-like mobile domain-containing protein [Artemisia annua]|uniref:Aminotransferase-like mobile domain-containing protein n=1 Tax=Artemisia annua TaxID=35608 RepID=A0A2U1MW84_ARTAN|nr:Aminotransferase-like mobile domain-containing protein [Artemisia annua]
MVVKSLKAKLASLFGQDCSLEQPKTPPQVSIPESQMDQQPKTLLQVWIPEEMEHPDTLSQMLAPPEPPNFWPTRSSRWKARYKEDSDDETDFPICQFCNKNATSYECKEGHKACSSCYEILKKKCTICLLPGRNRDGSITAGRMASDLVKIEMTLAECKNKQFECNKIMRATKKSSHEEKCPQTVCFCPFSTCNFANSAMKLAEHVRNHHALSVTLFTYGPSFRLEVETSQKHVVLQEEVDGVIFILNHEVQKHGRVFNVDCIGPPTFKKEFFYKLTVEETETTYSVKSRPHVLTKWEEHTPNKDYLTIPSHIEKFCIHVCIMDVGYFYKLRPVISDEEENLS